MAKANCQNRYVAKIRAVKLDEYHYTPTQVQSIHNVKQKLYEGTDMEIIWLDLRERLYRQEP
jgi:hypothetical protein